MKQFSKILIRLLIVCFLVSCMNSEDKNPPDIFFDFNENVNSENYQLEGAGFGFDKGIDGQALVFESIMKFNTLTLDNIRLDGTESFTVQCWLKTSSKHPTVFLSQKDFNNKGITAQKNAGWALYSADGTFGWTIGSGERRINYERDNGKIMPVNDGVWHQLTITFDKEIAEFRLYYDGQNKAIYKVNFDFFNNEPLVLGTNKNAIVTNGSYAADIENGLILLQALVDEFNSFGLEPLKNEEFLSLIVDPKALLENKSDKSFNAAEINLSDLNEIRKKMGLNPYTVFQNMKLTILKPVNKIYKLVDGKVQINETAGKSFSQSEQLYAADFAIDNLGIWNKALTAEEVATSYRKYKKASDVQIVKNLKNLNVGVWNIWHGGIHWSLEKDGWDSRRRIVEMIKEKNIDVVLMQETYSGGDFIAAELGYYFATTSDWDYKYQGSNISVLSRYPIKEIEVFEKTEFNNVGAKLAISKTQEVWAMSNWYGMNQFQDVYDFHESRFKTADSIPVFFGGDFNAVPHTDGGKSPASEKLLDAGFIDAFRSLYPNVDENPGYTHQGAVRIDQLYYKGKGIKNTATEVISTWPTGFPSDHFLIVSEFELDY